MELTYLDIAGTLIGLIYLYQEYKASIWLWVTGIIMPLVYTVVYWEAGLYADFGLQIYYVLAATYGFLVWRFGRKNQSGQAVEVRIQHFPRRLILPSLLVFLALWAALYWLLITCTNSNVPVLDSFGNALSIVGLWALSRKYLEQWLIWLVVDAEFACLYVYKDIPFTAGLYALYAVMCIAGLCKWRKMMADSESTENTTNSENTEQPQIAILADGDYPSHPIPLGILQQAQRLYCCDHAGLVAIQKGLKPCAIVGDGDSLSTEEKARYGSLYHQVDEQDYNDLTKTVRQLLSDHPTKERIRVAFLGTTGKREDHTLCNISLMMWYYRHMPISPILYTDYGYFVPASGRTRFKSFAGQQVSIINHGCTRLESTGLKWQSYAYEETWQGGLNEATGQTFTLDGDGDYLVFRTYEPKTSAQN